jgi:predicted sulfurtransferase
MKIYTKKKKCSKCQKVKTPIHFQKNRYAESGYQHCCRECQNDYTVDYYNRNRDYYLERSKIKRRFDQGYIKEKRFETLTSMLRKKYGIGIK